MVEWLETFLRRLLTWRKLGALFTGFVLLLIEDRFAGVANDKIDAIIERHSTDFTLVLKVAFQHVHMAVWALVGLMVLPEYARRLIELRRRLEELERIIVR
jgi:hypothetical protein